MDKRHFLGTINLLLRKPEKKYTQKRLYKTFANETYLKLNCMLLERRQL